jgi:hypothetical protein
LPRQTVHELLATLLSKADADRTDEEVSVLQLRVLTDYAEFVFDIVPPEDRPNRYCSVMSSNNVAAAIVAFASRTAVQGVFHAKLADLLRVHLSVFPESCWTGFVRN